MPDVSKRLKRYSKVQISNVNMGGIADSAYAGGKNSVDDMLGFDIHDESGILKVSQALTKDNGALTLSTMRVMLPCSNGLTYIFGLNGEIWSRTSGAVYTLEATSTNGQNDGAAEYQGYIYYFSASWIGRWQIGTAWSTRTEHFQALSGADRPTTILNGVLYFGNGYKLGQIDAGVVTLNALTLETNYQIKCLGQMGTDLLVGTSNSTGQQTQIFRWNTWSVSFTNSDPIPETSINAFLPMDNVILLNAGVNGNIYIYDGNKLELYKKIRLDAGSAATSVFRNAVVNFKGKALFGLSVVFSLARTNRSYPYVLNKEVGMSSGVYTSGIIWAMCQPSASYYLVGWTQGGVTTIDKYDTTAKFTGAYIKSRMITVDRFDLNTYGDFKVGWRTKPANTSFTLYTAKNNGSLTAIDASDQLSDTDRNIDYAKSDIGDAVNLQVAVYVTPSGNNAPEIEAIEVGLTTID